MLQSVGCKESGTTEPLNHSKHLATSKDWKRRGAFQEGKAFQGLQPTSQISNLELNAVLYFPLKPISAGGVSLPWSVQTSG